MRLKTPTNLLFDGANIWASNSNTSAGVLTKVRASDGTILGTYSVGMGPYGMAFDGTLVWVANYASGDLSTVNVATGATTLSIPLSGCVADFLGYDGSHIWANCLFSGTVQKLAIHGNLLNTIPTGTSPGAFAFDGTNIWVANSGSNTVSRILASCTTPCTAVSFAVGSNPWGITFDGKYIRVANHNDGTVSKLLASTGAQVP